MFTVLFIPPAILLGLIAARKIIEGRILLAENKRIREAMQRGERRTVGELFERPTHYP